MSPDTEPLTRKTLAERVRTGIPRLAKALVELLRIPEPELAQTLRRIELMERDVVLPLKAVAIAILLHSFLTTPWIGRVLGALEIAVEYTQALFWIYLVINLLFAGVLIWMYRLPPALVQWTVFACGLADGIFLAALTLVTGGYDSILFWLFMALIVRSAVSVPRATSQLMLNLTLISCYVLAGFVDVAVAELSGSTGDDSAIALDVSGPLPAEPLVIRLVLLFLMTICAYSVQVLMERQRRALEEAREFAMREGQLRAAGRLAAEFAHQIKNPLAIINNAAFSLKRALARGKTDVGEQIRIIQEEVERSDRIITDIMGYAQLSEGRVEKIDIREEIDKGVARVFPPAAGYPVKLKLDVSPDLPPLVLQRRHFTETLVNVLQNAREALGDKGGRLWLTARLEGDYAEISIRDDGPGIPPERQEQIFQAYYTTREKGTGLGLATVKHNVEVYGGKVRVESALGKGACFILSFPTKTPVKPAQND